MKNFEPAEVQTLAAERKFLIDQSEWRCPACGEVAVRSYLHRADRPEPADGHQLHLVRALPKGDGGDQPPAPGSDLRRPLGESEPEAT